MDEWKKQMMENTDSLLTKWSKLINELKDDEAKLLLLKKYYETRENTIINKTNFKEIYGANNEKIRKAHVKKELKNTVEQKEALTLKIEDSKRKISFLKAATYAQIEIMRLQ